MLLTTVVVGACAAAMLLAYRSFRKQLDEKESALATASTARLTAEAKLRALEASLAAPKVAFGEVRGIDGQNNAMYRLGVLKHAPPKFKYFDPQLEEERAIRMKEIKLPRAKETHEICFEPVTRHLFVSQMVNSVLIRIPVGPDGMLADDQDAWHVGPVSETTGEGMSGLHNISLSPANPGCVWLSLQFTNTLLLLDAKTMAIRQILKCPQLHTRENGQVVRIGGPHCVRECGQTGDIVVALKGNVPCHPGVAGSSKRGLAAAITRVCCNPDAIKARMEAARAADGDANPASVTEIFPEGFALWRINPKHYDRKKDEAFGGRLYATEPSPPMVAIDKQCNVWACQDKVPKMLRVDYKTGEAVQHDVSLPEGWLEMTGPAIACAPDGAVWTTLLGGDGAMIRISPTGKKSRYELPSDSGGWMSPAKYIHMAFVSIPERWFIFNNEKWIFPSTNNLLLISSNLVDDKAINAITYITFNPLVGTGWEAMLWRKDLPLPTQNCCCHRIEIVHDPAQPKNVSCVVSELASSRLFQMQLYHVENYNMLDEHEYVDGEYAVYVYNDVGGADSKKNLKQGFNTKYGQVKPMEEMNEQKAKGVLVLARLDARVR